MRKAILLFTFFSLSHGILSQNSKLDSLFIVWEDVSQPDSSRAKAYTDYIAKGFIFSNPDSARVLLDELLEFSSRNNITKRMADAYSLRSMTYYAQSNYPKAMEMAQKGLDIFTEIDHQQGRGHSIFIFGLVNHLMGNYSKSNEYYLESLNIYKEIGDEDGEGNTYNNIGLNYEFQGYYPKALEYYEKSLNLKGKMGLKNQTAPTYDNIGTIYRKQNEFDLALDYYQKGLDIFIEQNDKRGISHITGNMGVTYREMGDYSTAMEYFERGLRICSEIDNKYEISQAYNNIGITHDELGELEKALDFYERGLEVRRNIGDKNGIIESLTSIGNVYIKQNLFNKAIISCNEGLKLAEEDSSIEDQKLCNECLYKAYKSLGDPVNALIHHENVRVLNDSLQEVDTAKKLQLMEFNKEKVADSLVQVEKDLKVEMAHQEEVRIKDKNRNIAIGAGVFFLLVAGGFFWRWRYVKRSKAIIEKEKDRSESLLLNILPAEIAEELKIKGSAVARDFDMASILFTDFKEFTQVSEKLSAKELIDEINYCFKGFDHICEKYGIEKIKTIGDAYMAAGGLPVPSEGSVKKTILAALEMQSFIGHRIKEKLSKGEVPFEMRLGIHTGPVVAGIVAVKKFQYDIWGDTVNTASRMESNGEIGKVNISQDTYELIKHDSEFVFESRGKIEVKGKGLVEMYFIDLSSN